MVNNNLVVETEQRGDKTSFFKCNAGRQVDSKTTRVDVGKDEVDAN